MEWTREGPTIDGYYWLQKVTGDPWHPERFMVSVSMRWGTVEFMDGDGDHLLEPYIGPDWLWAGPIEAPEMP